jgi:hypothetical protein
VTEYRLRPKARADIDGVWHYTVRTCVGVRRPVGTSLRSAARVRNWLPVLLWARAGRAVARRALFSVRQTRRLLPGRQLWCRCRARSARADGPAQSSALTRRPVALGPSRPSLAPRVRSWSAKSRHSSASGERQLPPIAVLSARAPRRTFRWTLLRLLLAREPRRLLTDIVGIARVRSSQGGVALRRGVVSTETSHRYRSPGARAASQLRCCERDLCRDGEGPVVTSLHGPSLALDRNRSAPAWPAGSER